MALTIADRFTLGDIFGQGGMGTIHHGIDTRTSQSVAVKCLKTSLVADNPALLERFAREGEALRTLDHPNIVKMLDLVEHDGQHYLVMEYVTGGSLRELMQSASVSVPKSASTTLPVRRVLEIALELADALTRAHHLNIVHRDIKPANVLLAEDGTPRLTDFGVAHIGNAGRITQDDAVVGTPHYLSPEALNGDEVDARSDIWSFGVMLFEMLAGTHPFEHDNLTAIITAILTKPAPDLEALRPDTPISLVDLVYRMMERDVNSRIPSIRQVGAQLEAILHERTTPSETIAVQVEAGRFNTPTMIHSTPKHNLPAQTTAFVGRASEMAELSVLLAAPNTRLVSILASGGMGKTRLALEIAEQQQSYFPDGVVFASLTPLSPADDLVQAIAEAIDFHFQGNGRSPQQQLLDFLANKQVLLVMDSFEHMVESAALISDVLQAAPKIKIIVTSRERLNLQEETSYYIKRMALPSSLSLENAYDQDAIQLFLQSARRVHPGFELQESDLDSIAQICELVHGLPLGLVLAASWLEMLSLEEVCDEISQSIDFLETNTRNMPDRHRSIRAVFESSWNYLTEQEREVFMKLSVFRGGFTREAAQAVTGASLRTLLPLVTKSLLRREPDTGRFHIDEFLRHYAQEHLESSGDSQAAYKTHASYFADFMAEHWPHMAGHRQKTALTEVEADIENARAGWYYYVKQGNASQIKKFLRSFWIIYDLNGWHLAGIELFEAGVAVLRSQSDEEARSALGYTLAAQGLYKEVGGFHAEGFALAEESVTLLREATNRDDLIMGLVSLFMAAGYMENFDLSTQAALECLQVAEEIDDSWGMAKAKQWLASMAIRDQHYDEADTLAQEALALLQQRGDRWSESILYIEVLGSLAISTQQFDAAKAYIQRGVKAAAEINFIYSLQTGYYQLGYVAALQEDYLEAGKYWSKAEKIGDGMDRLTLFGFAGTLVGHWGDDSGHAHAHAHSHSH